MKKISEISIIVFSLLILSIPAYSAEPIIIDNTLKSKNIGLNIEYLADKDKKLTYEDITSKPDSDKLEWKQSKQKELSFGLTKDVYWVRFTIKNMHDKKIEFYLLQQNPTFNYINLFVPEKNGKYKIIKTGNSLKFSQRPYEYRSFLFPLELKAGMSKTYFMSFKNIGYMKINLGLWSRHNFIKHDKTESIILWVFYVILAVMAIYNIIIFLSTRDLSHIFYVMYIINICLQLMSLDGMAFQFLWPNSVWWNNISILFFLSLTLCTFPLFLRYFLRTWEGKTFALIWDMIYKIIIVSGIIIIIVIMTININNFIIISSVALTSITTVLYAVAGLYYGVIVKKERRSREVKFLISAFALYLLGALMYYLKSFGVIPENLVTNYSLYLGIAAFTLLFSLALADRINIMRKELRVLNLNLEEKVLKRTGELMSAKEEVEAMVGSLVLVNDQLSDAQKKSEIDMKMAINVQTTLFPKEPPKTRGWDIAFYFQPMTGVSGDLFDFYTSDGMLNGVTLFDVSGHGIASGLITMIARSVFYRNFKKGDDLSLDKILEMSNKDLINEMGDADNYLTGIMLRVNGKNIEYVNAAHPHLILKKSNTGKTEFLNLKSRDMRGRFLGIESLEAPYDVLNFQIDDNDFIILYSDCIYESMNIKKEAYGFERLKESMDRAPEATSKEALDFILKDFYNFIGDNNLDDDLTIVVLKKTD